MGRYAVYALTLRSLVDISKNTKGELLGINDFETCFKSEKSRLEEARRIYKFQANQIPHLVPLAKLTHWKQDGAVLCGKRIPERMGWRTTNEKVEYVNCPKCIEKLKAKRAIEV